MFIIYSNVDGMFGRNEFEQLLPYVDAFSLMTYDFSNPSRLDNSWLIHYK